MTPSAAREFGPCPQRGGSPHVPRSDGTCMVCEMRVFTPTRRIALPWVDVRAEQDPTAIEPDEDDG